MSSATNDKRGHLENEFQRRMHDAEASPSPDLWARIDQDLTIQENKYYKGRMVLYRQLAAACFVLFMLAGALLTYNYKNEQSIDAGIAAMQLNTEPGAAVEEMAVAEEATPALAAPEQVSASVAQSIADAKQPKHKAEQAAKSTHSAATGRVVKAAAKSIAPGTANSYAGAESISSAAKYSSISAVAVTSKPTANTEKQSIFGSQQDDAVGNNAAPSRFSVGRSFFQTARQAITSVPYSYRSSATAGQSIANEAARTRSLVELSKAALANNAEMQKRAEELALAVNSPAPSAGKEEKEAAKESRWSVGLAYSPSYFNQNIQMPGQMMETVSRYSFIAGGPNKSDMTADNMNQARDEFEANTDPAFSYAAEVKAGFKLFRKIKLLAGIGFTQNTAKTKSSYIINQFVYKPGTDERVPMPSSTVFLPSLNNNFTTDSLSVDKTKDFYVNYRYRHITLPVGLQYEGNIGKDWFWYGAGGMAANFLIETKVMASNDEVQDVKYDQNDDSPFRRVQFSGNVSAGVGKRISNAVSVTAGPEFRGYFNSLLAEPDKALAPQGNPYTIGVNMSVNYNLGQK